MNTSRTPEVVPSPRPAAAAPTSKNSRPPRENTGWRWVFLCVETALCTLSVVSILKGGYLHADDHPLLADIVVVVFFSATFFLLFASPFFFRRLGWLAVFSWLNALAVVWVASLPVF